MIYIPSIVLIQSLNIAGMKKRSKYTLEIPKLVRAGRLAMAERVSGVFLFGKEVEKNVKNTY